MQAEKKLIVYSSLLVSNYYIVEKLSIINQCTRLRAIYVIQNECKMKKIYSYIRRNCSADGELVFIVENRH